MEEDIPNKWSPKQAMLISDKADLKPKLEERYKVTSY
jgi:hypothetical protein